MNELLLEVYTLEQALIFLKNKWSLINDTNAIFQLAKEEKIQLCFHNCEWVYVRTDETDRELEPLYCKPLDEWLLVPTDRRSTGTAGHVEQFWGELENIYPILNIGSIREATSKQYEIFYIDSANIKALHQNKMINLAKVSYARFPEKGDENYEEFLIWITVSYSMIFASGKNDSDEEPIKTIDCSNSNFFFKLTGYMGRGVVIKKEDVRITKKELERFLSKQKIIDVPQRTKIENKLIPTNDAERKYLMRIIPHMKKLNNSETNINEARIFEEFKSELIKKYSSIDSVPKAPTVERWLDNPNEKPENRMSFPRKTLKKYIDKVK